MKDNNQDVGQGEHGVDYGAPVRDSQAVPSLSRSSWCGSSVRPPAATKNDCAVCQSVKSPQLRSSPNGSNPTIRTGIDVGTVVAVAAGVLVTVGTGTLVAVGVAVDCGEGEIVEDVGSVVVGVGEIV
jgi:hypothetical protein